MTNRQLPQPPTQPEATADPIPFEPAFINIPIYLALHDQDEDNPGVSQLDVFFSALFAYRDKVTVYPESSDKALTLDLIDEVRDEALSAVYTRLSESADILHDLKYKQPR